MAIFDKTKDYEKLKRDVAKANKRIRNIERGYGEKSWAINQLYEKLDSNVIKGINKNGLIRINKNMSDVNLRAIQKATNQFLESKTSTLTGIKGVVKDVKKSLQATYGDIDRPLTNKEVNILYDLVEDKNKRDYTERIGASTIWNTSVIAKDVGMSKDKYIEMIEHDSHSILTEEDKRFLEDIYNRYMS